MTDATGRTTQAGWMLGLGLASLLVPLNSTMIAVALVDIADDFEISKGTTGLLITVYLMVMLFGQPLAGRLADRVGSRRLLMSALVGFALSSLLASFANSFALLIAGRVLQAVFGTALLPVARTMIRLVTPAHERGRNFGMQESLIGVGAASGPLVGGLLVELSGWSGVFLVNVPIAVFALGLVRGVPIGASSAQAADRNRSKPRLRSVLTAGSFAAPFASQAAAVLAQYSLLLTVPIVLDDRGWSSAGVGAGLVLLTVGMVVSGPAGGRLGDRTGRRFPVYIGLAGATIGTGLAMVAIDSTPAVVLIGIAAFGLGFGLALPNLTSSALETAPPELAGATSGVWSMSRYVGSIPASLLFTVVVSDDVAQAQTLLVVALGAMIVALGCASLMGAGHDRPE